MALQQVGLLYAKKVTKKDGTSFDKYLISFQGATKKHTFTAHLSKAFAAKMTLENWALPVELTLGGDDYFIKTRDYTAKDGSIRTSHEIVIKSCQDHKPGHFEQVTIADLLD